MPRCVLCVAAVAALLWAWVDPCEAIELVRDGEPAAVIVVGKEPGPVAMEAAHELQRVIKRASGAALPIYLENEFYGGFEGPRRGMPRILVGDCEMAREAGVDVSQLPKEGFVVKTVSFAPTKSSPEKFHRKPANRFPLIILAGRDEADQNWGWRGDRANQHLRGTAYAVYDFLEKDLGVRWLWPGELGEVVPHMKTIDVTPEDRTGAPELAMRVFRNSRYYSSGMWRLRGQAGVPLPVWTRKANQSTQWQDHLRLGDSAHLVKPSREGVDGAAWVEKYGETHPEYFAVQGDGSRLNKHVYGRVRLCLSNPEVIDLVAKEVCDAFDNDPGLTMYGIELSDVFGSYCQCPKCKAWGPTLSDLVARHWAAVADKVAEKHPDKLLYAHPYHKYIDPPEEVTRLPENIVLFPVGQNLCGYTAEPDHDRSIKSWLGWAKLNNQPMYWRPNYPCSDVGLPLNYARQLGEDIKLFHANKLAGVDIDHMRGIWAGDGLNYYVACRLFWDPNQDVDAIIDDYCDKGFGPAAKEVRAYFDEVERITRQIAEHEASGDHPIGLPGGESAGVGLAVHFTPEKTAKLAALLDAADAAAGDDQTIKDRVAFLRTAVEYAALEHRVNAAGRKADKGGLTDEEIAQTRALLAEREAFLQNFIGRWELEPEVAWTGADWVKKILDEEQAAEDMWADLWLTNDEVVTLPEDWRFKTDPDNVGTKEAWFAKDLDDSQWGTIKVGEFWERQGHAEYDGAAWYRRKITLPASLKGKKILFAFGAADEDALVFIDGERAGARPAEPGCWDKRFVLDLTDHVKPGVEQTYAIRIIDSVGAGGLWKPVKVITPKDTTKLQKLSLEPVKDGWLRFNYADTRYGKDPNLAVGSKDYFRTLLAWELPEGLRKAKIRSAKIVLPMRYVIGNASYAVYPAPADWQERSVTWNNRETDKPWKDAGGGKLPKTPIATASPKTVSMKEAEAAKTPPLLTFDVSRYVSRIARTQSDVSVIIVQKPPTPEASMSPHSREAEEPAHRPCLEIEYDL